MELRVSVDSNFAAWLNGSFVGARAFSDLPGKKTYSAIDVSRWVVPGRNTLVIQAYYCGLDHSSYTDTGPGLWFALHRDAQLVACSNAEVLCRSDPAYANGHGVRLTPQRGYNFAYDARKEDGWTQPGYLPDDEWKPAVVLERSEDPTPRPLPMVEIAPRCNYEIIAQGRVKRAAADGGMTPAEMMQSDFLSALGPGELFAGFSETRAPVPIRDVQFTCDTDSQEDGVYLLIDLYREECGLIDIELDAGPGMIVDIAVGEHLADLRVRAAVGGRNFASRYITRDGRQRFTHYAESYAGRYVQLHLTQVRQPVRLIYAGFRPTNYPVENRGAFTCSDSILDRMFEVSRRTLHLCMHERYEDCPWREQALYAGDLRAEALVGYYVFGEHDMSRVSLELMTDSVTDEGFLPLCAPGRIPFTIPSFTMGWLLSLAEYIRFSGDTQRTKQLLELAAGLIARYRDSLVGGLLPAPQGKQYWHFYDWAEGLVGKVARTDDDALQGGRFDAAMNFYLILALKQLAAVLCECGQAETAEAYRRMAEGMAAAAHDVFWDSEKQAYKTYAGQEAMADHYAELVQSLALRAGVPSAAQREQLLELLSQPNNAMVTTTLGMAVLKYEAMLDSSAEYGRRALAQMKEQWQRMLFAGATTFWETTAGHADMMRSGSLCHGFSATPAYVFQAYVLGIKPIKPGFASFQVRPVFGDLANASGTVPTPHGDIEVTWEKQGDSYRYKLIYPQGLVPKIAELNAECTWTLIARESTDAVAHLQEVVKAAASEDVCESAIAVAQPSSLH